MRALARRQPWISRMADGKGAALAWRITRLTVSLGLLGFLVSQIDISASLEAIAHARLDLLILLLLVFIVDRLLAAYRWYVLLRGKSAQVTLGGVTRLVLVSGFVGYFMPGTVGIEFLRIYGLTRATSDPLLSVTSVLVERLFALVALVLLMLIGFAVQPPGLPVEVVRLAWIGIALVIGVVLALMSRRVHRLTLWLLAPAWLAPARSTLQKLFNTLEDYARQRRVMLWSLVVALIFQLIRCLEPAIGAAALGAQLPLVVFVTYMPMIVLITLVPISLGGLGVQDVSFVYLFGFAGMPAETALPLSLLIHAGILLSTLPGAWLYAGRGLHG